MEDTKNKDKTHHSNGHSEKKSTVPLDYNQISKSKKLKLNLGILTSTFKGENSQKLTNHLLASAKRHKYVSITIVLIFLIVTYLVLFTPRGTNQALIETSSNSDYSAKSQATLNRRFEIPIHNSKGEITPDKLLITLTTIDVSQKILIQGKPATARDTKAFLILNLEIENSTQNQLTVRPVDLLRLINDQGKSFAPDIHNNDVITEPISTKKTRAGFVIDEDQSYFRFTVGEINGAKETIEVNI